jgi:hypothetical protein
MAQIEVFSILKQRKADRGKNVEDRRCLHSRVFTCYASCEASTPPHDGSAQLGARLPSLLCTISQFEIRYLES